MATVQAAETKCTPPCGGISNTIGSPAVDESYEDQEVDIQFDALVVDKLKEDAEGDENGDGGDAMVEDGIKFRENYHTSLGALQSRAWPMDDRSRVRPPRVAPSVTKPGRAR